jgi:hypothetical protein
MRIRSKPAAVATIAALVVALGIPVAAGATTGGLLSPLSLLGRQPVVHVTQHDADRTIHVSRGTLIEVDLQGSYDPPAVDRPEVLREVSHSGGYPTTSDARAVFTAIGAGAAAISSRLDMGCMHTNPHCMIMTAPVRVNFVVDGAGTGGGSTTSVGLGPLQAVGTLLRGVVH